MSQSGEEMIAGLSKLLDSKVVTKTASTKVETQKVPKKKANVISILKELSKLASTLDESGAWVAAQLVDDSITAISSNMDEDEDPTEIFEEELPVSGNEEGMGSRMERTLQDDGQPPQEMTPEGLGMSDFNEAGGTVHEDKMDALFRDPAFRAKVKEFLGQ